MKISDYFQKPITTFCLVQGVNTRVVVEAQYHPPGPISGEQVEVTNVKNLRSVSVIDSMYLDEVRALEDQLLAKAHSDIEARRENARSFALELQAGTVAQSEAQRGVRIR